MCGIAGLWANTRAFRDSPIEIAKKMTCLLAHRGPDGEGVWADADAGIALGHRRLAIIDLSDAGRQPMESPSGRYVVVYNGEIYNFSSLRSELEVKGFGFKGASDTEVLLAAIEAWGLEGALGRFNGMFAFALWDRRERTLSLARDRVGKKPLYYGWIGEHFVFASELKAFRAFPGFEAQVDRNALAAYVRHNYVPSPYSIFKDVYKLPSASFAKISHDVLTAGKGQLSTQSYWYLPGIAKEGAGKPLPIHDTDAIGHLDALLQDAVAKRMVADVPLGVFLSGGIDSSLVTGLMQAQSSHRVKSFCIAFEENGYNEASDAAKIAKHLGTEHLELRVTSNEAREVIPSLPDIYDEPFADPSQIPTYCVARLARRHVTVALSGDGGDEGFYGYSRYPQADVLAKALFKAPYLLRRAVKSALDAVPVDGRVQRFAGLLTAADPTGLYKRLMSYHLAPSELVVGGKEPESSAFGNAVSGISEFRDQMMVLDMLSYLPDDVLVKVDRASMAASLEVRAPLLDYRVLEYAWQLPFDLKYRDGNGKWIFREILKKYVPENLFDRPKQGFGIPHDEWLRGPLFPWAEALLDENRLKGEGFFRPESIRKKWTEHLSGKKNWGYHLWGILMFQAWYERWK